ncbi:MAG: AAA family ATPase [Succinimonas sp.]|nr:AAA family ATPase [Succinimonas sp.]
MGTFLNPGGSNAFTELAAKQDSCIFVDKTDFISETIDRLDAGDLKLIAFTKPRRFGKTVTAHMLASYYSKGADSKALFSGLKVTGYARTKTINGQKKKITYEEYLNKCNVIYWDMNSIDDNFKAYKSDESLHVDYVDDIVDYLQYVTLLEIRQNREFEEKISKAPLIGRKSLKQALVATEAKFVLIMDEWDLIYREYRDDETLQEKFMDMLAGLFKASDGLSCFSLAYLTGILPIKKYNSESALNNFDEYNMLQPDTFAPYFGFTDEEVTEICKQPMCSISKDLLKEWYEGYKFTLDAKDKEHKNNVLIDVYNPNSVCKAISRNNCGNFWSSTSSNKEAIRLINMNFAGIKDDILSMLAGGTVFFNFRSFNSNMVSITSKDQVFSLLTCLGYLGCNGQPNAGTERYAYVPNREIRETLIDIVREQPWYNSMPVIERSEKLFQAIRSLNAKTTAEIVGGIHNSPYVSVIGYNKEEALVFCLISGLMWCAESSYDSFRELPAGKGFADLVFVPKSRADLPIMIIEFKRDYSAEDALNQIKEQDYAARYRQDGDEREVLLVGLNYSSETKEHHCLIEKM